MCSETRLKMVLEKKRGLGKKTEGVHKKYQERYLPSCFNLGRGRCLPYQRSLDKGILKGVGGEGTDYEKKGKFRVKINGGWTVRTEAAKREIWRDRGNPGGLQKRMRDEERKSGP